MLREIEGNFDTFAKIKQIYDGFYENERATTNKLRLKRKKSPERKTKGNGCEPR